MEKFLRSSAVLVFRPKLGRRSACSRCPQHPVPITPMLKCLKTSSTRRGLSGSSSDPALANRPELAPYQRGHYYFEAGTIQLKHLNYVAPVAASLTGPQLSKSLVGKRITIRGKLFSFKCGPGIALDDVEFVCIENMHSINPYLGMFGKRVEATGTLRFFHDSTPFDENVLPQRVQDHYYFQEETTRVRLVAK